MSNRISALKITRIVHLYLGVFIAPAILFFAFTGALQTFSLHDAAKDGSYKPANWIVVLAQLHKKQTTQLPAPKDPSTKNSSADDPKPQKKHDSVPKRNTLPMKIFFLVVSIGLICLNAHRSVHVVHVLPQQSKFDGHSSRGCGYPSRARHGVGQDRQEIES